MNPFLATFIAVLCGAVAGLCTGVLHTVFKIPAILSGILTMIALYSVNIRIMDDKATVAIAGNSVKHIILKLFPANMNPNIATIIVGVIVSAVLIALLYLFFGTELGCACDRQQYENGSGARHQHRLDDNPRPHDLKCAHCAFRQPYRTV